MKRLFVAAALAVALTATAAPAQDYPSRPIHVLTTSSAGGLSDIFMRVLGEDVRLLVSDVYAAEAYPLGLEVLDRLGPSLPPDDDDTDDPLPGGDLRIVEDFGMPKDEVELVLDDVEAYPDEQLSTIATRIGFGEQFDALVEQLD